MSYDPLFPESMGWQPLETLVNEIEQAFEGARPLDQPRVLDKAREDIAQIRQRLMQAMERLGRATAFELLVQSHQAGVTDLINRLDYVSQQIDRSQPAVDETVVSFIGLMQNLLDYFRRIYPEQFSQRLFLPGPSAKKTVGRLWDRWLGLRGDLPICLLTQPDGDRFHAQVEQVLRIGQSPAISYHLVQYLDVLFSAIPRYQPVSPSSLSPLLQLTVELNFNFKGWIRQAMEWIGQSLGTFSDPMARWQKVQEQLKQLIQLSPSHTPADPAQPSIHHCLEVWLQAEADFLEKMSLRLVPSLAMDRGDEKKKGQPITCAVSVDQLGVFFRAAKELDLLKAPSLKALFDTLAPQVSTTSKLSISPESMRTKSYSPEKNDIEQLTQVLTRIVKKVNSY